MTIQTAQFVLSRCIDQAGIYYDSLSATIERIVEAADGRDRLVVQRDSVTYRLDWSRVQQNLNVILDDDLLVCTDTDGITYKVTGAQFKSAVDELLPEDGAQPNGTLILESGSLKVQGGLYTGTTGAIGRPDGVSENVTTSFSKTYTIPGEYQFPMENMQRLSFYGSTNAAFNFKPGFDVSVVENMSKMFQCCYLFDGDISGWDTSRMTNMMYMFNNARAFNQEIGGWDVSEVGSMVSVFNNAHAFNQNISSWDTSNVSNFSFLFYNARSFNQTMSAFDTSAGVNLASMFHNARGFNQDISEWDVSQATNMHSMFRNATEFVQDISPWCVTKIRSKPGYFDLSTPSDFYNKAEIQPQWGKCAPRPIEGATPKISVVGGGSIANDGDSLQIDQNGACEGFDTPFLNEWQYESTPGSDEFIEIPGATNETYEVRPIDHNRYIRLVQHFGDPNVGVAKLASNKILASVSDFQLPDVIGVYFDGPGTLKVNITKTTEGQAFRYQDETLFVIPAGTSAFTQSTPGFYIFESSDITAINFFGTSSNAVLRLDERSYMDSIENANNCFSNLREFNQDLSWWDTSSVTNMGSMFRNAWAFDGDISSWDVGNVTNMSNMFVCSKVFNGDISGWNTERLLTADYMFQYAELFNADLSSWNTSNVTNMRSMFQQAFEFNQELGPWDVANVTNMAYMFYYAKEFVGDISGWCVPLIPSKPSNFNGYCPLPNEFLPGWGKCPPVTVSNPVIA